MDGISNNTKPSQNFRKTIFLNVNTNNRANQLIIFRFIKLLTSYCPMFNSFDNDKI